MSTAITAVSVVEPIGTDLVPLGRIGDTTAHVTSVTQLLASSVQSPVTVPSGTSFPASPVSGSRFYRSDLRMDCLHNGQYWQSVRPHVVSPEELNNVLGAWSLSQNNGSVAYDAGPRAHDLTINAAPTINQLQSQISTFTLNGTSQYLSSTHADFAPAAAGAFSALVWFNRSAQPNADQTVIANDANLNRNWSLYIRAHNAGTSPDCLEFLANGSANVIVTSGAVPISQWCLAGFSYSNGTVSVRIFTDASGLPLSNTGASVTIGTANPGMRVGNNGYSEFLPATLGPVRVAGMSLPAEAFEYVWLNERALVTASVLSTGYTPPPPGVSNASGMNFGTLAFGANLPGTYGVDYTQAPVKAYDYYHGKGMGWIRVPFKWERIVTGLNGTITTAYFNYLKTVAQYANARGMKLMLDMHNYSMYKLSGVTYALGSATVPASSFYDAWGKIAQAVVADSDLNTAVAAYDIQNEPHDNLWTGSAAATYAQGAIDAIRTYDTAHWISIPGLQWSHSYEWNVQTSTVYDGLTDAQSKLMFQFHEYFWWPANARYGGLTWTGHWGSRTAGTYTPNAASYISNPRLLAQDYLTGTNSFINWLAAYKTRTGKTWVGAFCGEIGFPDNALGLNVGDTGYVAQYSSTDNQWLIVMDEALKILKTNGINWTWWQGACNGWSNGDPMNLDPRNADWTTNANAVDRPQMADFVTWL